MANGYTKVAVFIGVLVVLGIVFGAVIDSLVTDTTQTFNAFDTFSEVAVNGTWTASNIPLVADGQVLQNADGVALTENTNYTVVDATGVFTLVNQNGSGNYTYSYTKDEYLNESLTRTFIVYLPLFFLVGLLSIVAFMLVRKKL